jgi:hypothetical protein
MAGRSDDLTLEMKRIFPAAPSVVFAAFSDALVWKQNFSFRGLDRFAAAVERV